MTSIGATSGHTGNRPGAGLSAARPGMSLLVLDLSRVPSCDPAGLAVLIGTQRRARLLGIVVRLAAPSVPVAKLLCLTGLDRSLTICPDLRGALAVERHEPATTSPSWQVLAGEQYSRRSLCS